jgi:PAS domain S-box-containing protein
MREATRSRKPANRKKGKSLRERAEELLGGSAADVRAMAAEDVKGLVHELSIHQVELELQNQELRDAQAELAHARDRYADLYELAPVAYITFGPDGKILEANLRAAILLGVDRRVLLKSSLSRFVARGAQDDFYFHRRDVFSSETTKTCEIEMRRADESPLVARLESVAYGPENDRRSRTALIDVTERRRAEEEVRALNEELELRIESRTAELARANDDLRRLSSRLLQAEESERRRISRELHDDFSQRLGMLLVDIESLEGLPDLPPKVFRRLKEMDKIVGKLAEDCHRLSYSLHPSILDHLGLPAALARYVEELRAHHRIEVVIRERGLIQSLDPSIASCLYRIAQEALTNVVRHSKSRRATLRLIGGERSVRLSVNDRGDGFDVKEARRRARTLGLISMEERAHLVGGTLTVQSSPGKGTILRVTCPWKRSRLGAT